MISEGVLQPACRIECLLFRLRVCDEIPPFKRLPGHTIQATGERLVAFKYEESMPGVASGGAVRFRFRRAVRFGFRRSVFFCSRRPDRFLLLVKFIPITKKRGPFPTTNPCSLVKLSDGRMKHNHSHLPSFSLSFRMWTKKARRAHSSSFEIPRYCQSSKCSFKPVIVGFLDFLLQNCTNRSML